MAEELIDVATPFGCFPSIETVLGRHGDVPDLHAALMEIENTFKGEKGAAVIIDNMADYLAGELKHIIPRHHVTDVVVLQEHSRPCVISVLTNACDTSCATYYSRTMTRLLKRLCLLEYSHLCDSNISLSFQRQLFYIGIGFHPVQDLLYPKAYFTPSLVTLNIVRYTLAGVLLHCEPMKDRFGNLMVRHLSSIQARVLWGKREMITVVEGKAGSGKSVLALEAMRRIKQHEKYEAKIVFLCRSKGLAAFMKYQTEMMRVSVDVMAMQTEKLLEMNEEYFSQYTDIFIDDAHTLPLAGKENWAGMYNTLFASLKKPNSHVYIFLDPDMQDYRGGIPKDFSKEIKTMARINPLIRRQNVKTETLRKILRNSNRICKFLGANLEDDLGELRSIRNLPEDGVFFRFIEDTRAKTSLPIHDLERGLNDLHDQAKEVERKGYRVSIDKLDGVTTVASAAEERSAKITLESRLGGLLKISKYQERHISILTGNTYDKEWVQDILRTSKFCIQDAVTFPVEHMVVDALENFEGLESQVILFIVPESWSTGNVGSLKYRLCIATRAISRLEFLVRRAFHRSAACTTRYGGAGFGIWDKGR